MSFEPVGNIHTSSVEHATYDDSIVAIRSTDIPSNMQMMCDYDVRTDGQPVYLGFAPRGLATSNTSWLLHKFTYDVSNRVTVRKIAFDSWDVHATTAVYA